MTAKAPDNQYWILSSKGKQKLSEDNAMNIYE
jgi:hypothetical protein